MIIALILPACTGQSESEQEATTSLSVEESSTTIQAITLPPAEVTVVNSGQFKSFNISEVTSSTEPGGVEARIETSPTLDSTPTQELQTTETHKAKEADTPSPTFTPPPAPEDSDLDHLWLARPVPQDSTVWTDKSYPYGSTKGGTLQPHHGVEFNVPSGTEVLAAADGVVRVAGPDGELNLGAMPDFYGNVVVIDHGILHNGLPVFTLYGHLSEVLVEVGQEVDAQEVIAISGASGVADGAHLHFEVRVGENSYPSTRNPILWLYPFPNHGVVAGRIQWPDGSPAYEVPVTLDRLDAPSPYRASTSYAEGDINGDDGYGENFAFDDVEAGYYLLTLGTDEYKIESVIWVFPYRTTFVDLSFDR